MSASVRAVSLVEDAGPLLSAQQLVALLGQFGIGAADDGGDDGAGGEELTRLRLAHAVLGAVEAHVLRAQSAALEAGADSDEVSAASVAAFGGADAGEGVGPLWLLQARVMNTLAGLACLEPDPRAPGADAVLDAAKLATAGVGELIGFRRAAATGADEDAALATLAHAAGHLRQALKNVEELLALVETLRRGRPGRN